MNKKVCILQKVHAIDPRSFYKQGRSLVNAGFDTTIISYFDKEEFIDNVKFIKIETPKNRLARFMLSNIKFLMAALKEKSDVYHFHDVDFIPMAILLKLITRKKVIYDVHEAHPEYMLLKQYLPNYLKVPVSKAIYILEQTGALFFDAIITNDNYVLNDFKHDKKEVIFNYPVLDFFDFAHKEIPYKDRDYDIVFIGSLPKWHFQPMLDTSELLDRKGYIVKWLLLPHKDAPTDWIRNQIEERNLMKYFTIEKTVPFISVPEYLYKSRIGIITIPPYKKYLKNIPLKIFEYMGCGLPVISSDLPPSRQFVEGKDCALLVKHDPSAYANAIISLLENPMKAEQMGLTGKKLVFDHYNWTIEEKKLLSIYKDIIGNE